MDRKMEAIVASLSRNREIVDMLDEALSEPGDRAYIVCSVLECKNNIQGRCTIHTVKNQRQMLSDGRCSEYSA